MTYWRVRGRSISKAATSPEKNQDRWSRRLVPTSGDGVRLRVAVADGATQSFRPAEWADGLISGAMEGSLRATRWSRSLTREARAIADDWRESGQALDDLPWHQQARALRGGAAAFVGVEVWRKRSRWVWRALAIGDSNLFHLDSDGNLIQSFPLATSSFSYRPILLTTKIDPAQAAPDTWSRRYGRLGARDILVLSTDAVSWWLLSKATQGAVDLDALREAVADDAQFDAFVAKLRAQDSVPDDDMTMVLVERT